MACVAAMLFKICASLAVLAVCRLVSRPLYICGAFCAQVNYQQLPINQPKCPYHNNMQDGLMQMTARDEEVRQTGRLHHILVFWSELKRHLAL